MTVDRPRQELIYLEEVDLMEWNLPLLFVLAVPDFREPRCIQLAVVQYVKWSKSAALCNPMRNGLIEENARERQCPFNDLTQTLIATVHFKPASVISTQKKTLLHSSII